MGLGFLFVVLVLVLVAQAGRLAQRAAYRRGFRAGIRAAADQVEAAERIVRRAAPRRLGGWSDFERRLR